MDESRPTITAHMYQEENDQFQEALLIAAQNGDIGFDMIEPEKYSLALIHSEELIGGDHFKMFATDEDVDDVA